MILKTVPITKKLKDFDRIKLLAKEAFPKKEYLSPNTLIWMAKSPDFSFLALYDNDKFVGYVAIKTYKNLLYLFFLVIDSKYRSKGYGSSAIDTLKALYPSMQHTVDMEMIEDNAPNLIQRVKRRNFYLKNGYKPTGHYLSYAKVNYEILCMDDNFDFDLFREMMNQLTIPGFRPKYFE